jgi:hypothetical protein
MGFHWNKGLPFGELSDVQQGEDAELTSWEQLNLYPSTFWSTKFLTIIPIVLYIVTLAVSYENETFVLFNTVATLIVVIAKFDFMLGVRLFGINK